MVLMKIKKLKAINPKTTNLKTINMKTANRKVTDLKATSPRTIDLKATNLKRSLNGNKGQIAVFLTIIFLSIIVVTGILVDASRIIAGEAHVRKSVENAAKSVLASYNSRLKEDYGLFALGEYNEAEIIEDIKRYINMNLVIGAGDGGGDLLNRDGKIKPIDFYGFRIEEVRVTPIFNFTGTETVKKQILEYMKYRVPENIVEGFLKKVNLLKEVGEMSEVYGRKMRIEESLGELQDIQQGLKINISGTIGDGIYVDDCIEKFNEDGVRDLLITKYVGLIEEYGNLERELEEIEKALAMVVTASTDNNMADIEEENNKGNKDTKSDENNEQNRINYLKTIELKTIEEISEKKKNIIETYNGLREDQTISFIEPNREAIKNANKLLELGTEVNLSIKELKEFIGNELETGGINIDMTGNTSSPGQSFKDIIMEELEKLSKLIPDEADIKRMIMVFENNIKALEKAVNTLDEVEAKLERNDISDLTKEGVFEKLSEVNSHYKKVEYNYYLTDKDTKTKDPRKILEEIARNVMKKDGKEGVDMIDAGINIDELPSKKKIMEEDFDDEDVSYLDNFPTSAEYEGNLEELEKEIEFSKISAVFSKKAINFVSSIGKAFSERLEDIRDMVYINEYIMRVFGNYVEAGNTSGTSAEKMKERKESFFNAEVEYILHGSPSENINVLKTKGQILLIRFVLNTIHVYIDAEKRQQASAIATALAGWWTGGTGIPIVKNLIICAWGMGEAILDLKDLIGGKIVPLYKTKKDWKLDLDIGTDTREAMDKMCNYNDYKTNDEAGAEEHIFNLNYQDYLRIFLLLKNTEQVLGRIQDIIEINIGKVKSGFKMGNTYAGIRVEVEVSMKYLFLTRNLMPSNLKTHDGRHLFRILLYEEY
ncbi:MAG: hypothetical protein HPY74_16250 [Firmicutes bacterium]|nr:hypothetical protein [Bacillota bacterium]